MFPFQRNRLAAITATTMAHASRATTRRWFVSASSGMEEQPASSTLKVSLYWSVSVAIAILARQRLAQDQKSPLILTFRTRLRGFYKLLYKLNSGHIIV